MSRFAGQAVPVCGTKNFRHLEHSSSIFFLKLSFMLWRNLLFPAELFMMGFLIIKIIS
ncbi:hypothetical protein [Daejeonella sp. H1SJ63]|uniref:hypothetical protein n=1 Tax=Daejeonella sp. H1SJ63 TaxID=3034145 RepID=UPI0023EB3902|nr:hypothetical protein [Daejeonella sp. H1SJ63]